MTFARLLLNRRRDLLTLLPDSAYELLMARVPVSKHPIWLVNHPGTVREILSNRAGDFARGDLMVDLLRPLTRNGLMIAEGADWQRQHRLVAAAFDPSRLSATTARMAAAIAEVVQELVTASAGAEVDLGALAGRLSAHALYRALFSRSPTTPAGQALLDALDAFETRLAEMDPSLLFTRAGPASVAPDAATGAAASRLRAEIGQHVTQRQASTRPSAAASDILAVLLASPDPATGGAIDPDVVVDQIATFLIAGHQTIASALTWALFILSQQPEVAVRIGAETHALAGDAALGASAVRDLTYTRQILKEVLRLYPPQAFLVRTVVRPQQIRKYDLATGDLVVISPWLIHRHDHFWTDPEEFQPDRFAPGAPGERVAGSYLPFGTGPRACIGAAVAESAGVLALATLCRALRVEVRDAAAVMPACRMTIVPEKPVRARLHPV